MDKKRHKPHSSVDFAFEDGGGTKRLKEIKSDISGKVIKDDIFIDDYEYDVSELEFFLKKLK